MTARPVPALSELSVTEFLTLSRLGFFPHGLVIGSAVYDAGSQYDWRVATHEVTSLSQAMHQARRFALGRMREQAAQLGAEGVVDVRLEVEHHVWRGGRQVAKFVAMGTAIGFDAARAPTELASAPSLRLASGAPFTSDLTGTDFVTLLRAGYRPVTLAMGVCVYGLDPRELRKYAGRDEEIGVYTQAFFDARETAMSRLSEDVFREVPTGTRDAPVGIVGMTVGEATYGGQLWQGLPIVEFSAVGTAIAPLASGDPRKAATHPRPRLVVPLDR